MSGSHVPKQCRSCGGFCGGGYGNKFCQNTAHEDLPIHLESQRVGRQIEKLMKRGASLCKALEIVAKDAHDRAKRLTE